MNDIGLNAQFGVDTVVVDATPDAVVLDNDANLAKSTSDEAAVVVDDKSVSDSELNGYISEALSSQSEELFTAGNSVINIVLDPIFIIHLNMGVIGAAIATGIGLLISLLAYIIIFIKCKLDINLSFKIKCDVNVYSKLYSIGISSSLNLALPSFMIIALNSILTTYDESYVLILGVYYKIQTFLYFIVSGLVQGIRPIISYNEGANRSDRVNKTFNISLLISVIVMIIGTIIFLTIPDKLISLFTNNQETINNGSHALRIISFGFIVSSFSVLISGVFEALGKGLPSLIISLTRYVLIILVAYILTRSIGVDGVWHAFYVTEFIAFIISLILYVFLFLRRNKKTN